MLKKLFIILLVLLLIISNAIALADSIFSLKICLFVVYVIALCNSISVSILAIKADLSSEFDIIEICTPCVGALCAGTILFTSDAISYNGLHELNNFRSRFNLIPYSGMNYDIVLILVYLVYVACSIVIIVMACNALIRGVNKASHALSEVCWAGFEASKAVVRAAVDINNENRKNRTFAHNTMHIDTNRISANNLNNNIIDIQKGSSNGFQVTNASEVDIKSNIVKSNNLRINHIIEEMTFVADNCKANSRNIDNDTNKICFDVKLSCLPVKAQLTTKKDENADKEKNETLFNVKDFLINAEDVAAVLQYVKYIEFILGSKYGASGRGLHEKISSIEYILDDNTQRNLRKIATIRNRVFHEHNYKIDNIDKFKNDCEQAIRLLA